ncbi:MAG: hypothetical protein ABGY75_10980 [Gemmataceae bacterium]
MSLSPDRRSFLQSSAIGAVAGGAAFLANLPAVSAADAKVAPNLVRLDTDIEPLVRLVEDTPRDRLLEEVGARVKKGLPYRDVLAALLLAGVRNIRPRPNVGFKFHAVLVVNSAHQAALAGPDRERWLPLFWALDNFKNSQAQNEKESGWRMKPVDELKVPPARKAEAEFVAAMSDWDEGKADAAAAAVARHLPVNRAFDLFARFGGRDYRDIGHKIIYVANAFRTLQVIGWHHAEPVLRSLAFAVLKRDGDARPDGSAVADRVGVRNAELAAKLPAEWNAGKPDPAATDDLLAALRTGSDSDVSDKVVSLLGKVSPRSVWDAVFAGAGELLMRQPGIVGLHTLTTANALHHAYTAAGDEPTRKLMLLQAAAFLPLFRGAMGDRGKVADVRIDQLRPADEPKQFTAEDVFATLSKNKAKAAAMALSYLAAKPGGSRDLIDAGRALVFLKGTDSHDYKFSSAVMEDHAHLSAGWKDRFLAASLFWLKGSGEPDAKVVNRTRAALA